MAKKYKERILRGVSASPGIAIGTPFDYVHENLNVTKETILDHEIEIEIDKYKRSLEKTRGHILDDRKKALKRAGSDAAKIFDAHLLIIDDQVLIDEAVFFISTNNVQATYAVSKVMKDYQSAFEKLSNQYLSQRAFDIEDVCRRIIKNLLDEDTSTEHTNVLKGKQIVVTNNLYPSDTLNFDKDHVLGIVTEFGGKTSHAAILSRSMEVPAVVGVTGITKWMSKTSLIIVDGYTGKVIINPGPDTFEKYKSKQLENEKQLKQDLKYSKLPSLTLDEVNIVISSNIQSTAETDNVIKWNSKGVGLFRTEFLFESSYGILSEEDQFKIYDEVSKKIYPEKVTIRLLDIGGDKLQDKLMLKEDNPFLGVRGMRLLFDHKDIFYSHLRAILRASHRRNLKIIVPFISGLNEMRKTISHIIKVKNDLISEGHKIDNSIQIGVMIEIPSAVMISEHIAKIVDFFSIGTNDLTQYALAADRGNEKVSDIYNSLHPSIIKMIDMTITSATKKNIPVSLCGQMAGYP